MKTATKIAGINLNSFICNASGPNDSTLGELRTIAESNSAIILMKTCTVEPRAGNPEPRYVRLPLGSIQSMGLPNLGYKKYIEFAKTLKNEYEKPIIASVAGFTVDEYVFLVKAFQDSEVDLIEVNLSCPNIEGKEQVGYSPIATKDLLARLIGLGEKPIGLKLPPYLEPNQIKEMSEIFKNSCIEFITCINSIGNTLVIDSGSESSVITPKDGLGGLCGEYIKPIALSNVKLFRNYLGSDFSIFGVGGVLNGNDAFEFLLAGANAVQIATTFEKEGPNSFKRIDDELATILTKKGYKSVNSVMGKLKNR